MGCRNRAPAVLNSNRQNENFPTLSCRRCGATDAFPHPSGSTLPRSIGRSRCRATPAPTPGRRGGRARPVGRGRGVGRGQARAADKATVARRRRGEDDAGATPFRLRRNRVEPSSRAVGVSPNQYPVEAHVRSFWGDARAAGCPVRHRRSHGRRSASVGRGRTRCLHQRHG